MSDPIKDRIVESMGKVTEGLPAEGNVEVGAMKTTTFKDHANICHEDGCPIMDDRANMRLVKVPGSGTIVAQEAVFVDDEGNVTTPENKVNKPFRDSWTNKDLPSAEGDGPVAEVSRTSFPKQLPVTAGEEGGETEPETPTEPEEPIVP